MRHDVNSFVAVEECVVGDRKVLPVVPINAIVAADRIENTVGDATVFQARRKLDRVVVFAAELVAKPAVVDDEVFHHRQVTAVAEDSAAIKRQILKGDAVANEVENEAVANGFEDGLWFSDI